jgi:hypothetical protein
MKITGKMKTGVSKPAIRAWLRASETVLRYHNREVNLDDWTIVIKDLSTASTSKASKNICGLCYRSSKVIELHEGIPTIDQLGTVILHEVIHAGFQWADSTDEKCTSTLTSKLKPTVAILAQAMLDNTFKNAAHIAHTRRGMAYENTEGEDYYDSAQWGKVGATDKYARTTD